MTAAIRLAFLLLLLCLVGWLVCLGLFALGVFLLSAFGWMGLVLAVGGTLLLFGVVLDVGVRQ